MNLISIVEKKLKIVEVFKTNHLELISLRIYFKELKYYLKFFLKIDYFIGMDWISGSVSSIRQNPAIFQQSGIRPDTGYQKTGYPANRILIKHFLLILIDLKFENFSIIPVSGTHRISGQKSGFQNGWISGKTAIRSIPTIYIVKFSP